MAFLGKQYIITLEQCAHDFVNDPDAIIRSVNLVVAEANLHILDTLEYRFQPQGLTFMLLLSQSHLLVHTWPEFDTMIVDVFVCIPNFDIDSFVNHLLRLTEAKQIKQELVVFEQQLTEGGS